MAEDTKRVVTDGVTFKPLDDGRFHIGITSSPANAERYMAVAGFLAKSAANPRRRQIDERELAQAIAKRIDPATGALLISAEEMASAIRRQGEIGSPSPLSSRELGQVGDLSRRICRR